MDGADQIATLMPDHAVLMVTSRTFQAQMNVNRHAQMRSRALDMHMPIRHINIKLVATSMEKYRQLQHFRIGNDYRIVTSSHQSQVKAKLTKK